MYHYPIIVFVEYLTSIFLYHPESSTNRFFQQPLLGRDLSLLFRAS